MDMGMDITEGRTGTEKGLVVVQLDVPLTRPHIKAPQGCCLRRDCCV